MLSFIETKIFRIQPLSNYTPLNKCFISNVKNLLYNRRNFTFFGVVMIYLKAANFEDIEKEWAFVHDTPLNENGFENNFSGIERKDFDQALQIIINNSKGLDLPKGYVPQTVYYLWCDNPEDFTNSSPCPVPAKNFPIIIGEFNLRHHLCESLINGSGHVGQFIKKEFRGMGFCTKGLQLLIEKARQIVPEEELYMHCNSNNTASLKVMLKNGGVIHHQNENGIFVRIKL